MTASLEDRPTSAVDQNGNWCTPFLAAVQFLTIAPPLIRRHFTPQELGRSVGWFPVVGMMLGGILVGLDWLLGLVFPSGVVAGLLLAAWVLGSGALHLDGFLDSCDGLFGGHTPEARLRIMRDEHAGAFAVIGGILLMLLKYAALAGMPHRLVPLIVAPVVARWGMALALVGFPYGRPEGLGRTMKDNAGWSQVALASNFALLLIVVITVLTESWRPPVVLLLGAVTTWAIGLWVLRRLPGLTGDVYGALCELLEVLVLLVFVAGERHVA